MRIQISTQQLVTVQSAGRAYSRSAIALYRRSSHFERYIHSNCKHWSYIYSDLSRLISSQPRPLWLHQELKHRISDQCSHSSLEGSPMVCTFGKLPILTEHLIRCSAVKHPRLISDRNCIHIWRTSWLFVIIRCIL